MNEYKDAFRNYLIFMVGLVGSLFITGFIKYEVLNHPDPYDSQKKKPSINNWTQMGEYGAPKKFTLDDLDEKNFK